MLMKWLYEKPKGMTYTDLCIWVDNNFYKEDCDFDTAYKYMWIIANMLGCKARYFSDPNDYQDYASYLAYDTYQRMIDPNKPKIKSVLNYMKSIMYFRKNAYERESYAEIIDTNKPEYDSFNEDLFKENYKGNLEAYNHARLETEMINMLQDVPKIIKSNIPKVYRSDSIKYEDIYISCLLSLLNEFTLPNDSKEYLKEKENTAPNFNDINYYRKHLDNEIILWHLPKSMETVVKVTINKVNKFLVDEIRSLSAEIKISDDEFNNIVASGFGDRDESN